MGAADLQRVFEHLSGAILTELDSRDHTVDELREFGPDIRLLLKLRKSVEMDLAIQKPDDEQPASAFPANKKGNGVAKKAIRRKGLLPNHWTGNG